MKYRIGDRVWYATVVDLDGRFVRVLNECMVEDYDSDFYMIRGRYYHESEVFQSFAEAGNHYLTLNVQVAALVPVNSHSKMND